MATKYLFVCTGVVLSEIKYQYLLASKTSHFLPVKLTLALPLFLYPGWGNLVKVMALILLRAAYIYSPRGKDMHMACETAHAKSDGHLCHLMDGIRCERVKIIVNRIEMTEGREDIALTFYLKLKDINTTKMLFCVICFSLFAMTQTISLSTLHWTWSWRMENAVGSLHYAWKMDLFIGLGQRTQFLPQGKFTFFHTDAVVGKEHLQGQKFKKDPRIYSDKQAWK